LKCAVALAVLSAAPQGAAVPRLAYATFLPGNFNLDTFLEGDYDVVPFELTILPRAVADAAGNTYVADTLFHENLDSGNVDFVFDTLVMKVSAGGKSVAFTAHVKVQIMTGLALDPGGIHT